MLNFRIIGQYKKKEIEGEGCKNVFLLNDIMNLK